MAVTVADVGEFSICIPSTYVTSERSHHRHNHCSLFIRGTYSNTNSVPNLGGCSHVVAAAAVAGATKDLQT